MKIWFDTEFIDRPGTVATVELLSIGLVREDGKTYYAEPEEIDYTQANDWVKKNVIPFLHGPVLPTNQIRREIVSFCGTDPEFWGWYATHDWYLMMQMMGGFACMPGCWPQWCNDVQTLATLKDCSKWTRPPVTGQLHNALDDAIMTRDLHWSMIDLPWRY